MKTILRCFVASSALLLAASPLVHAGKISDSVSNDSLVTYKSGLKPFEGNLSDGKYFAIYYSAAWCPPCRAFTPKLVEFYNRTKKKHPNFEIFFVSSDQDASQMEGYMRDYRMRFPALKFGEKGILTKHKGGGGIPNLVFVDADNNVIKGSYNGDDYVGPYVVLEEIRKQLASDEKNGAKEGGVNPFKSKEVNVFGR